MKFFIVSSTETTYRETATEAALAAGAKPWNWGTLARAITRLALGDELCVDNDISVFRISGNETTFEGHL